MTGGKMKVICTALVGGVERLVVLTTVANIDVGAFLINYRPGVGQPFYVWPSLPHNNPIACDFTSAPIVNADASVNNTAIDAMQANGSSPINPEDVLTWA